MLISAATDARQVDVSMAARGLIPVIRARDGLRASDRVFDAVGTAIRELRLPPGLLLSESDLAQQLHVSRTPLREAIVRLVDAGLLQVLPQVGTLVAKIRMSDVEEARFVRETLEIGAFELACTPEHRDVSVLHDLLDQQQQAHERGDLEAFFCRRSATRRDFLDGRVSGRVDGCSTDEISARPPPAPEPSGPCHRRNADSRPSPDR